MGGKKTDSEPSVTKPTRRSFGKIRKKTKNNYEYLEASYLPPASARDKWPWLPARITKTMRPEYKTDLQHWLDDAERLIRLDAWEPPRVKAVRSHRRGILFKSYAEDWVENRKHSDGTPIEETTKQKHRENLRLYLVPVFGDTPIVEISYKMVKDWYDGFKPVRSGRNVDSANRRGAVYRTLKAILNSAATEPLDDQGHTLIKESPALIKESPALIPAPKANPKHEALIPSDQQLLAIYNEMPKWIRLAVLLAGKPGLREGEILALSVKRIEYEPHVIHVREAAKTVTSKAGVRSKTIGKPKTKSSVRDAEYPSFLEPYIREHIDEFTDGEPDSLLFTAPLAGGIVGAQTLRSCFSKAVSRATPELTGMHFHDLRDTGLTAFMAAGGTLGETMGQGGHTSMKIASRYQKHLKSHMEQVMKEMDRQYEEEIKGTPKEPVPVDPATQALAGLLAAMEPTAIVEALKRMDAEQKKQVIGALPLEIQKEVILTFV